ncbi:hypothetical protein T484DRAFT_1849177, partial [Baffinella frigidus]
MQGGACYDVGAHDDGDHWGDEEDDHHDEDEEEEGAHDSLLDGEGGGAEAAAEDEEDEEGEEQLASEELLFAFEDLDAPFLEEGAGSEQGGRAAGGAAGGKVDGPAKVESVDGVYFFYQSADGQKVFLHPLSTRVLLEEHGGYLQLPHSVSGTVLELEAATQ